MPDLNPFAAPGGPADSAGQPWAGRSVPDTGYGDDDGRPDRRLEDALLQLSTGDATVFSSPIAAAAAGGSVTDFWLRDTTTPPGDSFDLS